MNFLFQTAQKKMCLSKYIDIIELLLVSGLDLDHENNEGVSARMLIEEKFKTSKKLMNSIRKD